MLLPSRYIRCKGSECDQYECHHKLADRDAEIERLRADLVWAVRKGVMVGHDECVRPCIWFDVHRGVEYDGTDAGILAALRRAMEGEG